MTRRRVPGITPRQTRAGTVYDARIRLADGEHRKTFTRREDAIAWRTARLREKQLGDEYQPAAPLHGDYREQWLRRYEVGKRPATVKIVRLALAHLKELDPLTLTRIRAADVEQLVSDVARTAPRMAQQVLRVEKAILRSAKDRGYRVDEAVLRIRPPKAAPKPPVIRPYADCEKAASYMPETLKRMPLLAYLTGMRLGELAHLEDGDLCLSGCQVESAAHVHVRVGEGRKTSLPRVVVLSRAVVVLVREQMLARPNIGPGEARLRRRGGAGSPSGNGTGTVAGANRNSGDELPESVERGRHGRPGDPRRAGAKSSPKSCPETPLRSTLLFPHPLGRWNKDSVGREWRAALKLAGMSGWRFHDLKHAFCTLALSRGVNPVLIAQCAGHFKNGKPDPSLIWQLYGHLYGGAAGTEIAKLDEPDAASPRHEARK